MLCSLAILWATGQVLIRVHQLKSNSIFSVTPVTPVMLPHAMREKQLKNTFIVLHICLKHDCNSLLLVQIGGQIIYSTLTS